MINKELEYIYTQLNQLTATNLNIYIMKLEMHLTKFDFNVSDEIIYIKSCEVPIEILIKENSIKIYTKSRFMRAYIFVCLLLKINNENWYNFFVNKGLSHFITNTRKDTIEKLMIVLQQNSNKDFIIDNYKS